MRFKRVGCFSVYILKCSDGTYYTGYTPDITRRVNLHNKGKGAKYTRTRRPVRLVWHKEFRYFKPAFQAEREVKKLDRKHKKELIAEYRKKRGRRSTIRRRRVGREDFLR
jgi:putative endonuclease